MGVVFQIYQKPSVVCHMLGLQPLGRCVKMQGCILGIFNEGGLATVLKQCYLYISCLENVCILKNR